MVFLEIHPFQDGNGRLSQVPTTLLLPLAEQVRRLYRKVEREKIVPAALPELSLQIVKLAREHRRIATIQRDVESGSQELYENRFLG